MAIAKVGANECYVYNLNCRYNFLHAPRDLRGKNIEALRTLLELCDTNIDALQDSWLATLECVSRLQYVVSWPAMTATIMQGSNQISRDAIIYSLRELSGKATDQVFMNSVKLPSEAVVEFFTALCSVSAEELKQTPPRTFSLQKIVEISYYNMARIRMVICSLYEVLFFYGDLGCMFVIFFPPCLAIQIYISC